MLESTLYQPVKSGKIALSFQVARQIIDLIANNRLAVGTRLPALDELTVYLGVSRTAVREAIKLLAAWGVVTVAQGRGTFVAGVTGEALRVPFRLSAGRDERTFLNLHQVREAIEPYIAALAAKNAEPSHVQDMKEAIEVMDRTLDDPTGYIAADLAFHTALAKASGNDLFLIVIQPVIDLLRDVRSLAFRTPGGTERGQTFHRRILQHVMAGQADEAQAAMSDHIAQAWREIEPHLTEGSQGVLD